MEILSNIIDFVLHVDAHISALITQYGAWTLGILSGVIFMETGVVLTPFLPGDSLIFAAATFAGRGLLDPWALFFCLTGAAILGDTTNYWIGHHVGARAYSGELRWIKRKHIERTNQFFEKHGGSTIFLARFVPIVRTFTPFVAGASQIPYSFFIRWSIFGGVTWVGVFTLLGYFFGNIPFVQKNFELAIVAIVLISVVPVVVEGIKARREFKKAEAGVDA